MIIHSLDQLESTKAKLQALQERYRMRKEQPAPDPELRRLTLRSLKQLINQLTEEIVRFEAGASPRQPRELQNDQELACTREKLRGLEEHYLRAKERPADNERVRKQTLRSLKGVINQLKEEIIRYEAHAKVKS